jgi:hypothetical protein
MVGHQHLAFSQAHYARHASQQEQAVSPTKLGHSSETPLDLVHHDQRSVSAPRMRPHAPPAPVPA